MLSTLFRKEWRQLRTLRFAGILLGVLMPVLAVAGAEAGRRGWLPFGERTEWTSREVFAELAPALLGLFVWPLMALLLTAQALTGDSASGTEPFLLERPVSRNRIWCARVGAAFASALTVAASSGAAALGVAAVAVGPAGLEHAPFAGMLATGVALIVLAILAALPAASLIRSPVGAVLAGLLFAAAPALAAAFLGATFPLATLPGSPLPVGIFVPWLVLVGYVWASTTAETRGEPAGRGRRRRAGRALGVAAILGAAVFFGCAALAVRLAPWEGTVFPSPRDGVSAVLSNWGAAGLVETPGGNVLRRVPSPTFGAAWSANGSELAVATSGSAFGALEPVWRVEFVDRDGRSPRQPAKGTRDTDPMDLAWSGSRLLAVVAGPGEGKMTGLVACTPGDESFRPLPVPVRGAVQRFVASDAEGFLALMRGEVDPDGHAVTRLVRFRWDGDTALVAWERSVPYRSFLPPLADTLSPSGRFLTLHVYEPMENPDEASSEPDRVNRVRPILLNLESGEWSELPGRTGSAAWTHGDRLTWVSRGSTETAVFTGTALGAARFQRAWSEALVTVSASPDRQRVLVVVTPRAEPDPLPSYAVEAFGPQPWSEGRGQSVDSRELWVLDPSRDEWTRLSEDGSDAAAFQSAGWAGPRTIYRYRNGVVRFESVSDGS